MSLSIARSELILGGQKSGKSRRAEWLAQGWLGQSSDHRAVLIATAQPWDNEMRARIQQHQSDRAARAPGMATVEEALDLAGALRQHSTAQTLVVVDCLTLWLTNWTMPALGAPTPSEGRRGPAAPALGAGLAPAPPAPIPAFPQGRKEQQPLPASSGVVTKLAHAQVPGHAQNGVTPSPFGEGQGCGPAAPGLGAGLVPAPPAPIPAFPQRGKEQSHDWQAQAALFLEAIECAPGPVVLVGNEIGLGVIPLGREVRAFVDALGLLNQQVAQACQRVTLMAAGLPLTLKEAPT